METNRHGIAQRTLFDEHLAIFVKEAGAAVRTLVKELKGKRSVVAAKAILDQAFRAMDSLVMQEELDNLRTLLEALRAGQMPKPPSPPDGGAPPNPIDTSNPWPAFTAAVMARDKPPAEKLS